MAGLAEHNKAGAQAESENRKKTLHEKATSNSGKAITFVTLCVIGVILHMFLDGSFLAGLLTGVIFWFIGGRLEKAKRKADPNAKALIWIWPGVIRTIGIVIFLSVWLASGMMQNTEKVFTRADLHTSCEAGNLENCALLREFNIADAKAKQELANAYRDTGASASPRSAATSTVATPPPAAPAKREVKVAPCKNPPRGSMECVDIVLFKDGYTYQKLVPHGYCPMWQDNRILEAAYIGNSATVEVFIKDGITADQVTGKFFLSPKLGAYTEGGEVVAVC